MKMGVRKHPRAKGNHTNSDIRIFASAFNIIACKMLYCNPIANAKRFHTYGGLAFFMKRRYLTKYLKTLWAAHHFVFISQDPTEIAAVLNVSTKRVEQMMRDQYWDEALKYWNYTPSLSDFGDLKLAKRLWTELVESNEHINLVEYPDKPIKSSEAYFTPETYALLNSHLFCADNLSDAEIRERLIRDGNPVQYDGQHMLGYHWFAYPNETEGLYSKVFARVNVAGDLVVGSGDDTSLVCIKHGRLTLTRQVSDEVVSVTDRRLLVCL